MRLPAKRALAYERVPSLLGSQKKRKETSVDVINKFVVKPSDVWPNMKYDVQVLTSVDGGETFWYCGNGRFCKNLTDVFKFVRAWTDPYYEVVDYRDRRHPSVEIVTKMPDGWVRDMTAHDKPIHGEWIENYRTGERAILYMEV